LASTAPTGHTPLLTLLGFAVAFVSRRVQRKPR
jgi:hypothetical protein